MSDITTHLLLPYILASQAQKHVTHNEALRLLDAMVQLSVLDRDLTAPPASPADGDRHIVASGATGLWAGWDLNVAFWIDGVWMRLVPRPGWLAWVADEAAFVVWNGSAWDLVGEPVDVSDAVFSLVNDTDPTRKALFSLSGISTGVTRTFTLPNTSSELAILAGTQTFSGNKTFSGTLTASGTVTVSAASASIGTATGTATYGMGTGATTTGVTKTVNLGTGGASGSTTVVNIGSATAGAGGTTVINTPTVTFANAVTQLGMPQANLTAQLLGLGGATADSYNRLSMNTPAVLLNNAGAGIEATVNKAVPANDAAFAFKTGFSARALIGLLGSDDFSFKVSPDGSAFVDALKIDRISGQVELPQPTILPGLSAAPTPPPTGKASVYARSRAGAPWIDVMRPSGRDFPLQPHFGVNRIANWSPSTGTTITTEGLPITSVGTVSHPTLAATNLATSMRRWRLTSAAVVDSVADQRSAGWACWRGNATGLGGWTFVTRLSLTTLQATGMGFFGLYGSTAALATTLTLATVINCIGIGFQRGTHANWQLVANDGAGAPTLTDMGASFAIATGSVLTLFIAAPPNGSSVWVRAVNEVTGAVFEQEITADLPAATQFLSPRLYINNGATAAAVAYDCAGVYVETDF
ncbi:DUF2793 domain-containing protein [Paracoccus sp. (in: a-proteobacteria)]|uniref:DUF2793 domain-containing protein n=1 Tax=Paracoccus sp. TaxID=267 RepID=UPI0032209E5B